MVGKFVSQPAAEPSASLAKTVARLAHAVLAVHEVGQVRQGVHRLDLGLPKLEPAFASAAAGAHFWGKPGSMAAVHIGPMPNLSRPKDLEIKGDHLLGPLSKDGPKLENQKVKRSALGK